MSVQATARTSGQVAAAGATTGPVADAKKVNAQENIKAALPVVKEAGALVLRTFPVIRSVEICLTSTALQVLAIATLKNMLYVGAAKDLHINDVPHALTSRANYIEAAAVGFACFITNVAMAIFFTIAAGVAYAVTLGKGNDHLNHAFQKHWTHAAYGVAAAGIGAIGGVSPTLGVAATGSLVGIVGTKLAAKATKDFNAVDTKLMGEVQKLYKQHHEVIVQSIKSGANSQKATASETNEFISALDAHVANSKSVSEFFNQDKGIWKKVKDITTAIGERKKALDAAEKKKSEAADGKTPAKADSKTEDVAEEEGTAEAPVETKSTQAEEVAYV